MQLSAGPDLPHTRTRPVHWLATTAALAAVLGAAALVQPADATATPPVAARQAPEAGVPVPGGGPDPVAASYPMECGDAGTRVVDQASSDLDGDGRVETVAVVSCDAGIGTPPTGVYVLTQGAEADAEPKVVETLMDPAERMNVKNFSVAGRTVSATLLGYSSAEVPRCCPDQERAVEWHWRDGKFRLTALPVAGSV